MQTVKIAAENKQEVSFYVGESGGLQNFMRIGLFTDTYYPEINGVANSVFQLKKELENRGNEVYVFTVSNPDVKEREYHVYRMKSMECPLIKERRMSCAIFHHWFQIIKGLKIDIIHTQTEFMVGHIGRKAARKLQIPLVHTYHTIYEDYTHYLRVPGNEKLKGMIRSISCICCDHADKVIVPTDKVKNLLLSYGVRRPIVVQPTGLMLSRFRIVDCRKVDKIRSRYHIDATNHVLVSIGRLSKEKNLEEIIEFVSRLVIRDDSVRLLIVGDGPERKNLEEQVKEKKLSSYVAFTGEVNWKEIQNYYAVGDVFTAASTSETQGLTYAEALACGKPILVRKDDCLQNLLQNGKNGYCYQSESEFIKGYQKLFENERCRNMAPEVRKSVSNISSEIFGKNVEEIYAGLINQAKPEGDGFFERIHSMAE